MDGLVLIAFVVDCVLIWIDNRMDCDSKRKGKGGGGGNDEKDSELFVLTKVCMVMLQDFLDVTFASGNIRWSLVHEVNRMQRMTVMKYECLLPSWYERVRGCYVGHPGGFSVVYIALNLHTKECYVGQTGDFQRRVEDEIRRARECRRAWDTFDKGKKGNL